MTGTPQETPPLRTAFAKSCDRPSKPLLQTLALGRTTAVGLDGTSSRDTPSVGCTSCAAIVSRFSPWPTAGAGLVIGGRDSETPLTSECSGRRRAPPLIRHVRGLDDWRACGESRS